MKRLILALLTGAALAASSPAYAAVKTIVLVHGAFADGSGWKPVTDIPSPRYNRDATRIASLDLCTHFFSFSFLGSSVRANC